MNPDSSAEMSLRERLAVAKQENKARVEGGFDKIEGKRSEVKSFTERTIEAAKKKVTEFRAWDRKASVDLIGTASALPEMSKIVVVDAKDRVVERAKDLWQWVVYEAEDIYDTAENAKDEAIVAMYETVENTKQIFREKKEEISDFFVETGKSVNEAADRGKNRLVSFWKRVQAVPHDIIGGAYERKAVRMEGNIERQQARLAKFNEIAKERRDKADALKGTKKEVAAALA